MKRKHSRKRRGDALVEMTPLIDMVFILLIFFIVTTAFVKETGVTVEKPHSSQARPLRSSIVLVAVTRGGSVHLAGRRIRADDSAHIAQQLTESGASQVLIQADDRAPLGLVLQVQDACFAAGAANVSVGALTP